MTRDLRTMPPVSLDDDAIGLLVRDLADGWTMPAVRLDAPSWRDRIRSRRARWIDGARGGAARLERAAAAAVVLTLVAALAAVVMTRPPQPAGSPKPTAGASNRPTTAAPSPLPKLQLNGDLPFPTRVLMSNEAGDIALVDLGLGTIGGSIARAQWPSAMTVTSSGLIVCICITTALPVDGYPTQLDIRLKTFTRPQTPIRDNSVEVLTATPDSRVPATRADHIWTNVSFSADDRFAFVGWSVQADTVWHSGITVVDIEAGSVASRQVLPDMMSGVGDFRRSVGAPRVVGTATDGSLFVARSWAEWATANVDTAPMNTEDDAYRLPVSDGVLGPPEYLIPNVQCIPGSMTRAGSLANGGIWTGCSEGGLYQVRMLDAGTGRARRESMPRSSLVDGETTAVSADGRILYSWAPSSSTLTRLDLDTGDRVDQRLDGATSSVDPLTALGGWLAPGADAKSILRGAVIISPDGSRLYLLGTGPIANEPAATGSLGVFVVDAATLRVIDRWPPTADYVSIALNADGSLLYAAGLPGVDASGAPARAQEASVTVYDTATGAQRLIAGQLGLGMLSFPGPIVP